MDLADLNRTLGNITLDCNNRPSYKHNGTSNNDANEGFGIEDILKMISITLYSVIFVLGTIGNGLVIWIAGFRMKETISVLWFFNLAITDFLCGASLPLRIAQWVKHSSYLLSSLCQLSNLLLNLNMSVSVLILAVMSVDRCVSVMWPVWAEVHRTCTGVRITLAIVWVTCFLLTFLAFYLYPSDYDKFTKRCYIVASSKNILHYTNQTIQLIKLVIMFVIPFFIIFISYVTIFFKLRTSKRPQKSQRLYKIIAAVVLCFFICWFPYYVLPLTPMNDDENKNQLYTLHIIIINLACLNSCINPIIYIFMGQDFKHGCCRSVPSRIERALSEEPNDGLQG